MKILGEKSLSSKIVIGLNILFSIISIIAIFLLSIIAKVVKHIFMNENIVYNICDFSLYVLIILTGMIALFIIYQFIKIFNNLKNNVLFSEDNSKRLNIISNSCFLIGIIYFALSIFVFIIRSLLGKEFVFFVFSFSLMLAIIFVVAGIGIKILNEIYKKAIEYKEENDFTI